MKALKLMTCLFFLILCTSCSTAKYKVLEDIQKEYSSNNSESAYLRISNGKINSTKKVFRKLDDSLSNDYVYIFSLVNHMPMVSNHFQALVYDRKLERTFYVSNSLENVKLITITERTESFQEEKLILKYYLNNRIEDLLSLPILFSSTEMGTNYSVLDSTTKKGFEIENLCLNINGPIFKLDEL